MRRFIHIFDKADSHHPENFADTDLFSVEGNFGFKGCFKTFHEAVAAASAWRTELEQTELAYRIFIEVGGTNIEPEPEQL